MDVFTPDKDRVFFADELERWSDAEVVFSRDDDGCLRIAVGEEKAVDSYNQWFDCSIRLTKEQTKKLLLWLVRADDASTP